jgi:hypothetical protein
VVAANGLRIVVNSLSSGEVAEPMFGSKYHPPPSPLTSRRTVAPVGLPSGSMSTSPECDVNP